MSTNGKRVKFNIQTAECGTCIERDKKTIDSIAYCKTCGKFLCMNCLKPHRKLVAMDNHELVNRDHEITEENIRVFDDETDWKLRYEVIVGKLPDEIEATFKEYEEYRRRAVEEIERINNPPMHVSDDDVVVEVPEHEFYEHCSEHPDEKIKHFCTLHQQLCCDVCKQESHHICLSNVKFIPDVVKVTDKKEDTVGKFRKLINEFKEFDRCLQSDLRELRKSKQTFLYDMKVKKREILNWVNLMEVRAVRRLEIVFDKCKKDIDRKRQATKRSCQELRTEMFFLKGILENDNHDDIYKYVKDKKAAQVLKDVSAGRETRQFTKSRFSLCLNNEFEAVRSDMDHLYELKFETNGQDKFSVRLKDDKHVSNITGCTYMDNGDIVLADRGNCKLKHMETVFKTLAYITVPHDIFDITAISPNAVAFTSPLKSTMSIAELNPSLEIVKTISTGEGSCWGVSHNDGLFALSVTTKDTFYIRVIDIESNIIFQTETRRLFYSTIRLKQEVHKLHVIAAAAYEDGRQTQNDPYIETFGGKVDDQVLVSVYNYLNHLHVKGIVIDRSGNAVVCCCDTDQIYAIAKTGEAVELILAESDGLCRPQSLCYDTEYTKLLVTSEKTDFIHIFRLETG